MDSYRNTYDRDALVTANKALYVISIIMISVINLGLIVKQFRKPLFYQNAKAMIISSLAIGDFLFALFPLVVMAELIYGANLTSCRLLTATATYLNYLIHFVYGLGLVTLGTEVLLRHRIYALNIHKGIVALFVSSIPWILGVIIILPLCLANVDFEYLCLNSQSPESMMGVSVFFPAALAVVFTTILCCVNFTGQGNNQFSNLNQPQVVYQVQQSSNQQHAAKQSHVNEQGFNQYSNNQPGVNQYPSNQSGMHTYPSNQPGVNQYPSNQSEMYSYPSNQPGVNQYPSNQSEMYSYPSSQPRVNQLPINQYTSNQPGVYQHPSNPPGGHPYTMNQQQTVNIQFANNQTANMSAISTSNRKTEVQRLLLIAIIFFLLVVPVGAVSLNVRTIAWNNELTYIVVTQVLYWLMVFRSFLTPLIMIGYSDL